MRILFLLLFLLGCEPSPTTGAVAAAPVSGIWRALPAPDGSPPGTLCWAFVVSEHTYAAWGGPTCIVMQPVPRTFGSVFNPGNYPSEPSVP